MATYLLGHAVILLNVAELKEPPIRWIFAAPCDHPYRRVNRFEQKFLVITWEHTGIVGPGDLLLSSFEKYD
jgi:hypothetical protein